MPSPTQAASVSQQNPLLQAALAYATADMGYGRNGQSNNGHVQEEDTDPSPLPWSDQTNAEALVGWYGEDMRWCERWKSWLVWDGKRWAIDETGQVMRWAKDTIKRLALDIVDMEQDRAKLFLTHIKKSLSYRSLSDMVKSAASEPGIAVLSDDFDRDQMLFNVQNGTLDLHTGQIRPHQRADMLMKCSPVTYDEQATCPVYDVFLDEIYNHDQDLITFDGKASGYTMTGDTKEQILLICHGTGNNGKSTRLSIMREVMGEGEYALRTDIKAFTEASAKYRPASAEYYLAKLHNVRFAYASETDEGTRLSESLIKDVTGGVDFINARLPYGHSFTFQPRFKLWLGTNHEPVIRGTDPAIWRRPRKIPFLVKFDGRENKDLFKTLCGELPGILNHMLRGCRLWQSEGLKPPAAVENATTAYKQGMDIIGRFIDECCFLGKDAVGSDAKVESTQLYEAYKKWCDQGGEEPMSQMRLAGRLKERGLRNDTRSETTNRIQWTGIGLLR